MREPVSHPKAQELFSSRKSLVKLLIKIPVPVIRLPVELVYHIHVQISDQVTVLTLIENFLHIQKKIMPVTDKFFVVFEIRCIYPFPDFNLTAAGLFALVNLKDVFKATILIISSQREQTAESRTETVDGTPSVSIQKYASFLCTCHLKMRQNIPVCNAKLDFSRKKLIHT